MSSYVFSLSDISIEGGSTNVSVNNADSFFGLIDGSELFVTGKLPVTIIAHDIESRSITLSEIWAQGDVINSECVVLPISVNARLLTAMDSVRNLQEILINSAYDVVYSSVEHNNTLSWVRARNEGDWSPSNTTTNLTAC